MKNTLYELLEDGYSAVGKFKTILERATDKESYKTYEMEIYPFNRGCGWRVSKGKKAILTKDGVMYFRAGDFWNKSKARARRNDLHQEEREQAEDIYFSSSSIIDMNINSAPSTLFENMERYGFEDRLSSEQKRKLTRIMYDRKL